MLSFDSRLSWPLRPRLESIKLHIFFRHCALSLVLLETFVQFYKSQLLLFDDSAKLLDSLSKLIGNLSIESLLKCFDVSHLCLRLRSWPWDSIKLLLFFTDGHMVLKLINLVVNVRNSILIFRIFKLFVLRSLEDRLNPHHILYLSNLRFHLRKINSNIFPLVIDNIHDFLLSEAPSTMSQHLSILL